VLTLYRGSGASDFNVDGSQLPVSDTKRYICNSTSLLNARGNASAARYLETIPFGIFNSFNFFNDDFNILFAVVPLSTYESLRELRDTVEGKHLFRAIAETISEIGPYIRFVAVELQMEPAQPEPAFTPDEQARALKPIEVKTLVNLYIGVHQGYLGDFSYQKHRDFYTDLGLDINPDAISGTTKDRFTKIISESSPSVQAKILEGILNLYPVGSSDLRTAERGHQIHGWITRLRGTSPVTTPRPSITSDVVERALSDAETLIERHDATSGVDRVHTAFHGFLQAVCNASSISISKDANMPALLAAIRDNHPKFAVKGPRDEEITRVIRSMGTIVDALNTIRNRASIAHPNPELLGASEAMLMVNVVRSLLHYLDTKLN
jgi:hypothetical protein